MKLLIVILLFVVQIGFSASYSETMSSLKSKIVAGLKKGGGANKAVASKGFRHALAKYRFYQLVDSEQFSDFNKSALGKEFLPRFLGDFSWLEKTLCQGVPVVRNGSKEGKDLNCRYAEAIIRLAIISKKYPSLLKNDKLKEMASATAFSTPFRNNDRAFTVRSFGYFYESLRTKQFIPEFYTFNPWMLRYVLWHGENSSWLQQKYDLPPQRLNGAAWTVSYRLWNIFDDSIHSHKYSEPWTTIFGDFQVATDVGGVCGSISKVGTLTANGHGAPCITMGQPGHCAYAYYNFDNKRWYRGNDVSRPSSPHHVILENTCHGFSEIQMTQDTFEPYKTYAKAAYFNWLGHLFKKDSLKRAESYFSIACKIKPNAYDFRNDYQTALIEKKGIKNGQIMAVAKESITHFSNYPDQAWQLVMNMQPLVDKLSQKERVDLVTFFHETAGKIKFDHHVMYTKLIPHQFALLNGNKGKVKELISANYVDSRSPAKVDLDAILNPKEKK